jgi:hypothetical protein
MSVPVYEPRVTCMAYCYGGSVVLELDEYPDVTDPLAVVKYADHVAALAEAEQRVVDEAALAMADAVRTGWAAGVAAARDAVDALAICNCPFSHDPDNGWCSLSRVRYAIDALTERGAES